MKIAYLLQVRPDLEDMIPEDVDPVFMHVDENGLYRDEDLAQLTDADAFVIAMEPVNEQILAAAPNLKIVQRLGVGYETLDLKATARLGIPACNIDGVNKEAVAEHVLTLILSLSKQILAANQFTQSADWAAARQLTRRTFEIKDKVLGIIGMGNTGLALARRAHAFEMELIYNDVREIDATSLEGLNIKSVDKKTLLETADIVSINADLNKSSRAMIDAAAIARLQPHALFVCCARGGIVDEAALASALHDGRIAGAGVDVFETEPLMPDNPLIGAPNCLLTSHVAGVASDTTQRIWDWAHDNVRAVVQRGERARWILNGV